MLGWLSDCQYLCFAFEPRQPVFQSCQLERRRGHHLQRNVAGECQIVRPIHFAHPAPAQQRDDAEVATDESPWRPPIGMRHRAAVENQVRLGIGAQHGSHRRDETRVLAARLFDQPVSVRGQPVQRRLEDGAGALKVPGIDIRDRHAFSHRGLTRNSGR